MKILHIIYTVSPEWGGPVQVILEQQENHIKNGDLVEIVSLDVPDDSWVKNCPITVYAKGIAPPYWKKLRRYIPWLRYGYSPHLVPWIKKNATNYDIVVVHGLWNYTAFAARRGLAHTKTPYVVYTHGMLDPWFRKTYILKHIAKQLVWFFSEGQLINHAKAVLFTTEEERSLARRTFWPYHPREHVVGFGIRDIPADHDKQIIAFNQHAPSLSGRRFLLFLGRIHPKKGCDILIKAFAECAKDHPDLDLVIAGPDQAGWKKNLEKIAYDCGIKNRIYWPGMLSGDIKWGAFRSCEAFILPSHQENFGVAVVEALACGKPVLISDKINIWREIKTSGAGFVAPDTQQGTAANIKNYLDLSDTQRKAMAADARAFFLEHFEINAAAEATRRVISQCISTSNSTKHIDIWHNILWSQYKGEVFSSIYKLADKDEFHFRFFQIAESDKNRASLSSVDLSRHRYPFDLLFENSYDKIRLWARLKTILIRTLKSNADLVLLTGYERPEYWLQLFILRAKKKKVAVFCDSTINDRKQNPLRGILKSIFFKKVDGIFGYGERSRDYAIHYGAARRKVYYRCQAAALPHDYTIEKAMAARLGVFHREDVPRFLYVGRLSEEKGLNTLIKAFTFVRQQSPQAQLILVGDGNKRDELKNLAQKMDIAASISFTGSKSGKTLFHEYTQATCLILPSISEPWGLVVNEALAYGCPVIVSDKCGCVPELVIEGKTGFIHKAGNAQDLAAKMLASITQFADVKTTANNCINLMSNYTPDKAATQIIAGCHAILGKDHYAGI